MKTVFLIRHSEPQKIKGLPTEQIPLSDRGEALTEELFCCEVFRDVRKVYASPYKRAYDTAAHLGMEITVDSRLRERELGDKTTLNAAFWGHQYQNHDFKNKDGESFNEVKARMTACVDEILQAMHDGEKVAVVSHAAAICAYLLNFCKIKVLDPAKKIREITYREKVILSGGIDTPSGFVLEFEDGQLQEVMYFARNT